jgi:hypothetical protein
MAHGGWENWMSAAARFNEVSQSRGWPLLCDDSLGFDTPKLKDALAYWHAQCAGRSQPKRTDLSPHGMKTFLSHVSLAEIETRPDGKTRWRTRLQGSDIDKVYGPMTGRYIDEVIKGETLNRWMTTIQFVLDSARPLRFLTELPLPDREPVVMDSLLAPLSSDGVSFDMLFNVSVMRPHDTWAKVMRALSLASAT